MTNIDIALQAHAQVTVIDERGPRYSEEELADIAALEAELLAEAEADRMACKNAKYDRTR